MPRKSSAALAIVTAATVQPRIKPGPSLTADEKSIFAAVVSAMPASFFSASDRLGLEALARHTAMAEKLASTLTGLDPTTPEFARVSAAQLGHSRLALAHSRALRVTLNARVEKDKQAPGGPATVEQLRARYAEG